jgi:hypothetical protein
MLNKVQIRGVKMLNSLKKQKNYKRFVQCTKCEKKYDEESKAYLRLLGNLYVGENEGVFGNSDWEGLGVPEYIFCKECLIAEIYNIKL